MQDKNLTFFAGKKTAAPSAKGDLFQLSFPFCNHPPLQTTTPKGKKLLPKQEDSSPWRKWGKMRWECSSWRVMGGNKAQLESIYSEDQCTFFHKGPAKSKGQRVSFYKKGILSYRWKEVFSALNSWEKGVSFEPSPWEKWGFNSDRWFGTAQWGGPRKRWQMPPNPCAW